MTDSTEHQTWQRGLESLGGSFTPRDSGQPLVHGTQEHEEFYGRTYHPALARAIEEKAKEAQEAKIKDEIAELEAEKSAFEAEESALEAQSVDSHSED